ncbi:uncharacterized protein LOC126268019 [Schistocerca gregaria]|uniref:uncharacterized protein LOC126268019 n=1 Tax=Schistocerca gregaria TaxID=7010 RepID=UPI00211EEADF|nr:uncharacterized protein LOC126268019 [Schistocerca gregaria]
MPAARRAARSVLWPALHTTQLQPGASPPLTAFTSRTHPGHRPSVVAPSLPRVGIVVADCTVLRWFAVFSCLLDTEQLAGSERRTEEASSLTTTVKTRTADCVRQVPSLSSTGE